jgi:predicted transcriptional regulator
MHPKAFLATKRNVKAGLRARSKILFVLEEVKRSATDISKRTGLGYDCIIYHLRSMRKERLVERSKRRPYLWSLTAYGQQRLSP